MRNPRFWLGLALSLVTLYLAFRGIDPGQLGAALGQASYAWLLPALVVIGLAQVVRAYRWGRLFYPAPQPPLRRSFSALSIGYLISTILPARLGDVVRAVLIGEGQGTKIAQAISTVIVERALDVFSIIAFLVILLPFVTLPPLLFRSALTIGVIFVVLSVALWLAVWQQPRALRLAHWVFRHVPRLDADRWTARVGGLIDGLKILHAPRELGIATLLSLLIWGGGGVFYNYLVMRAFGLQDHVVPAGSLLAAAAFVQVVIALGATVPSSPGYVGIYHAGVVLALSAFGIPQTEALAYALVSHAANFGLLIIIGAIELWRAGLTLGQVTSQSQTARETVEVHPSEVS